MNEIKLSETLEKDVARAAFQIATELHQWANKEDVAFVKEKISNLHAVNTFDQAREALKLALDYYRSKGTQKFNPYEVEQQLEKVLAAMEATHE